MKPFSAQVAGWRIQAASAGHLQTLTALVREQAWPPPASQMLRDTAKLQAMLCQVNGRTWFVKRYHYGGLKKLAAVMGRERARKSFAAALSLRAAGVPVPGPIACLQQPGFGADSWFVSEAVPVTGNFHDLAEQGAMREPWMQEWLLEKALDIAVAMQLAGWRHGDFKWANLLGNPDTGQVWITDLDGAAAITPANGGAFRDLARFLINVEEAGMPQAATDHFIRSYAERTGIRERRLRREITPYLARFRRRHQRSGDVVPPVN